MIQRIFIAIALPEDFRLQLIQIQDRYHLPVSWVQADNLHVTVLFLGAVQSENVYQIIREVERVAKKHQPFTLNFGQVRYGPDDSLPPRLVWLTGDENQEFNKLKEEIDQRLRAENLYYLPDQSRDAKIHVTLGRVKKWEWAKLEAEAREPIKEDLDRQVMVNEILIMESKLSPGRPPKYFVIETIPLKSL